MHLGLFGGSFDPVHRGHVELARACERHAGLDEVWFLPTATQPFKQHGPVAGDADRLAMLLLATLDEPTWRASRMELDRGGVSYTVDTLRNIAAEQPDAKLYFMMGADALHDLPSWREPEEICRLAMPLVVARGGEPAPNFDVLSQVCPAERVEEIRAAAVAMPELPIASSAIRDRVASGQSIEDLVTEEVAEYIRQQGLYGSAKQHGSCDDPILD